MKYLILSTQKAHREIEQAIRSSRSWAGRESETGTIRYCGEPRKDVSGKYPFPIIDALAENFIRSFDGGRYEKAKLVDSVTYLEDDV